MAKLVIHAENKVSKINKEIYGHFSEHLGRCIYGGMYVGEDSTIPNVNGMRTDVVEALKEIRVPVLRWPGGCFADEYHWKDGIVTQRKTEKDGSTPTGAAWWKTTALVPMNFLNCAVSLAARPISTEMWEAEPYRKCPNGWNI